MQALQGSSAWKTPSCRSEVDLRRDKNRALLSSAPTVLSQTRLHPCKMTRAPSMNCSAAHQGETRACLCCGAPLPALPQQAEPCPPSLLVYLLASQPSGATISRCHLPCRHAGTQPSSALWLVMWLGNQQTNQKLFFLGLCCTHLLVTTPHVTMDPQRAGSLKKNQDASLSKVPGCEQAKHKARRMKVTPVVPANKTHTLGNSPPSPRDSKVLSGVLSADLSTDPPSWAGATGTHSGMTQ